MHTHTNTSLTSSYPNRVIRNFRPFYSAFRDCQIPGYIENSKHSSFPTHLTSPLNLKWKNAAKPAAFYFYRSLGEWTKWFFKMKFGLGDRFLHTPLIFTIETCVVFKGRNHRRQRREERSRQTAAVLQHQGLNGFDRLIDWSVLVWFGLVWSVANGRRGWSVLVRMDGLAHYSRLSLTPKILLIYFCFTYLFFFVSHLLTNNLPT